MDYHNRSLMSSLMIPQEVYPAPQPYDRLPNVEFTVRGALGVRLVDALNPAFDGLDNPDFVPRMSRETKKITLRLKVSTPPPSLLSSLAHMISSTVAWLFRVERGCTRIRPHLQRQPKYNAENCSDRCAKGQDILECEFEAT